MFLVNMEFARSMELFQQFAQFNQSHSSADIFFAGVFFLDVLTNFIIFVFIFSAVVTCLPHHLVPVNWTVSLGPTM